MRVDRVVEYVALQKIGYPRCHRLFMRGVWLQLTLARENLWYQSKNWG